MTADYHSVRASLWAFSLLIVTFSLKAAHSDPFVTTASFWSILLTLHPLLLRSLFCTLTPIANVLVYFSGLLLVSFIPCLAAGDQGTVAQLLADQLSVTLKTSVLV